MPKIFRQPKNFRLFQQLGGASNTPMRKSCLCLSNQSVVLTGVSRTLTLEVSVKCYNQWRRFVLEIGGTSAEGASAEFEAPRGIGYEEGMSPSPLGRGLCPLSGKIFDFRAQKGEFWCILGATFAVELNGKWLARLLSGMH